ncbi:sensor domain CHASE2-containing protein [Alteromonadaceae bacterium Bs31]|nr:sensor domain CHASE2-containing protein [Alteromonadaceae bacterium Bs31]
MIRYLHVVLPLLIASIAALAEYQQWFGDLKRESYDSLQSFNTLTAEDNIVIVAIDEESLSILGRWPWSRRVHAQLINKLDQSGVKAIALDVLFSEPSQTDPQADEELQKALAKSNKVILPIYFELTRANGQLIEVPPISKLSSAAAALGHAHINCEDDGICRSVYLKEGIGRPHWPHFSLAVYDLVHGKDLQASSNLLPGMRAGLVVDYSPMLIYRDYFNLLTFQKRSATVVLSYADILLDKIPRELLRNKVVFVGATATGVHDIMATPAGRMPGIEVNSLIYQNLIENKMIYQPRPLVSAAVSFCLLLGFLMAFSYLSPAYLLLSTIVTAASSLLVSTVLLVTMNIWQSPVVFVLFLCLFYPLWSWLRLEFAIRFLHRSLLRIQAEDNNTLANTTGNTASTTASYGDLAELLYGTSLSNKRASGTEVVTRTIERYKQANQGLEIARQLVFQSLSKLQEAVIIFNSKNQLIFQNELSQSLLKLRGEQPLLGDLSSFLSLKGASDWNGIVKQLQDSEAEIFVEATLERAQESIDLVIQGRNIVIWRPSKNESRKQTTIVLLTFTDVSKLKQSERSRQETLNFISHDLRSPLVSILALTRHTISTSQLSNELEKTFSDIETYASRNLDMAESLLQLNRAETIDSESFMLCDFHSIADAAYSEARAMALEKSITVTINRCDSDLWVMANSALLERALINLLANAIQYSPKNSTVLLSLSTLQQQDEVNKRSITTNSHLVSAAVIDQGPGIPEAEREQVFKKFSRRAVHARETGAGLGLHFVKTVACRHHGDITLAGNQYGGSTFVFTLPLSNC